MAAENSEGTVSNPADANISTNIHEPGKTKAEEQNDQSYLAHNDDTCGLNNLGQSQVGSNETNILLGFLCPICQTSFPAWAKFDQHMKSNFDCSKKVVKNGSKDKFECSHCRRTFHSRMTFTLHLQKKHPGSLLGELEDTMQPRTFFCQLCPKTFRSNTGLWYHKRKHVLGHNDEVSSYSKSKSISEKLHQCRFCNRRFSTPQGREYHIRNNVCRKQTSSAALDIEQNSLKKKTECPVCNKTFTTKSGYRYHKKTHEDIIYQCSKCMENFKYASQMRTHICLRTCQENGLEGDSTHETNATESGSSATEMPAFGKASNSQIIKLWKCEKCRAVFQLESGLEKHVLKNKCNEQNVAKKPLGFQQCRHCHKQFRNEKSRNRHEKRHFEANFQCEICSKTFFHDNILKKHMKIHDPNRTKPYICCKCGQRYYTKHGLNDHVQRTHGSAEDEEVFVCPECGKTDTRHINHLKHMERHATSKPLLCNMCIRCFSSQEVLDHHIQEDHMVKARHACHICPARFRHLSTLTNHIEMHEVKFFQCCICHHLFATSDHLNQHKKKHQTSARRLYKKNCPLCNQVFRSREGFNIHMRTHDAEKQLKCSYCSYRTSHLTMLWNHLGKYHHQELPFSCKDCSQTFASHQKLTIHRFEHKREAALSCIQCKEKFKTKEECLSHMTVSGHTAPSIVDFLCMMCGKTYATNAGLKTHIENKHSSSDTPHRNDHKFTCQICAVSFPASKHLVHHLKKTHELRKNGQPIKKFVPKTSACLE